MREKKISEELYLERKIEGKEMENIRVVKRYER